MVYREIEPIVQKRIQEAGPKSFSEPWNAPPVPKIEEFLFVLISGHSEITDRLDRLQALELSLGRYPYNNTRITRFKHLQSQVESFLEQVYIIQCRILGYLEYIERGYHGHEGYPKFHKILNGLRTETNKAFKPIVRLRGSHIHHYTYQDKELHSVSLVETAYSLTHDPSEKKRFKHILELIYKDVRDKKKKWVVQNNKGIKRFLNLYFQQLKKIVLDDKKKLRWPKGKKAG